MIVNKSINLMVDYECSGVCTIFVEISDQILKQSRVEAVQ